jgi:hypothetical protein
LLIESIDEASGRKVAERTPSITQADRLVRALGTTLSEMLAEVKRRADDG